MLTTPDDELNARSQRGERSMKNTTVWTAAFLTMIAMAVFGFGNAVALAEEETAPEPTTEATTETAPEPLHVDAKGATVRLAYNTEGWVVLGYKTATNSVDQDWMLLEIGMTLMKGQANQSCTRGQITLLTPSGLVIPMATQKEFTEAGRLSALNKRGDMQRDTINYFPVGTTTACRIGYFSDPTDSSLKPFEQFEVAYGRGCVGRIFFNVPDGIQKGQYYLVVHLDNSTIHVPFKIADNKELEKMYKDFNKMKKERK
jgi:hypothetical protein